MEMLLAAALGIFLVGTAIGYVLRKLIAQQQKTSAEIEIQKKLLEAKTESQNVVLEAKTKAAAILEDAKAEEKKREAEVHKWEERLAHKEETLDKKSGELESEKKDLKEKVERVRAAQEALKEKEAEKERELERVAHLTAEEAKQELFTSIEKNYEADFLERMHKLELSGEERLSRKARDILAAVIQRVASSTASEVTTTSVTIPSEDLKGKIIGREGRNIRSLERAAGVEIIVDDTPGTIIISGFDPVRRQIAKAALEELIMDGRIQPAKIEEAVEKAKSQIEKIMKDAAEAAAYEVGVFDLDPRLMQLVGRLRFRTSYGQNVLQHSIEMSHIAGMLASELGADIAIAKKGALLHDIGKAVDHEVQGTHVEIGRRILQKFGVDNAVIQAMQSHHEEYPYETLESIIVQTADAVSASRPGARRDSVENYIKRLEDLEGIATSFEGVEKAYAIQAGREIRVFVTPEKITDLGAKELARSVADRVEQELKYPGEIKVHVIREMRAVEYAR
ncbi:MAG: ribonuclease Y [Candidatus Ryanbacteria bacterium]|nr:ribonuclease Y [Candidatus Ryanbacteria bacterium]